MIEESLIQSIVRNVVHRLQAEALEKEKPTGPGPNAPLRRQVPVEDLYRIIGPDTCPQHPSKSGSPTNFSPACLLSWGGRLFASTKDISLATTVVGARFADSDPLAR